MYDSLMVHLNNPELMSIKDTIINAIWSVISHTLGRILYPILAALYFLAVWVPLHIINDMVIIFKFFAQGLMPYLFGTTINPDGTIQYEFNWEGPLAKIMYGVMVFAMVFFCFAFLFSFTKNRTVDENGRPTMMQSKRIYFLKWPMLIVLMMIGTPIILTFFDTFVSLLLTPFGGNSTAAKVSQADMDQITTNIFDSNKSGSFFQIYHVFDVGISGNGPLYTALKNLNQQVSNFRKIIKNNDDNQDISFNGVDTHYLVPLQDALKRVITYYDSGFAKDVKSMTDLLPKIKVGEYISGSNLDDLHAVMGNLSQLHSDIWFIGSIGKALNTDQDFKDAVQMAVDHSGTINFNSSLFTSVLTQINVQTIDSSSPISTYLGDSGTSYYMTTLYGTSNNIGLLQLNFRTAMGEPFPLVQYFFTFITPDKNVLDWEDSWHADWIDNINWISAVLGIFLEFAMVMIMYNFVSASIKRIYLVTGYWIIGWVLMANGINNPQQVKKWYRSLFGQYFTIIIMFVSFQIAGVIFDTIREPIVEGLRASTGDGAFDNTWNWMGEAGMLFAAESAYQVAWQLSQDYAGTWGAQDQKFQAASSMALSTGKGASMSYAKGLFNFATGSTIRNAVTSFHKFADQKEDRKNKLRQRANNQTAHAKNEIDRMSKETERKQFEKPNNSLFMTYDKDNKPVVVKDELWMKANPVNMNEAQKKAIGFKGWSKDDKEFELQKQFYSPHNPQYYKPGGAGYALGLRSAKDFDDKTKFDPQKFIPGTSLDPLKDAAHTSSLWNKPAPPAEGQNVTAIDHNSAANQGKNYSEMELQPNVPYIPLAQQDPGGNGPRSGVPNEDIQAQPTTPTNDPASQNYSNVYVSGGYANQVPNPELNQLQPEVPPIASSSSYSTAGFQNNPVDAFSGADQVGGPSANISNVDDDIGTTLSIQPFDEE